MPRFILLLALLSGLPISAGAAGEFAATPISLADHVAPGDIYAGVRLLGALRLSHSEINGLRL